MMNTKQYLPVNHVVVHPMFNTLYLLDIKAHVPDFNWTSRIYMETPEHKQAWAELQEDFELNGVIAVGTGQNKENYPIYRRKTGRAITVWVDPKTIWKNRYELNQTPRTALANALKDHLRTTYADYVKSSDPRKFADYGLDYVVIRQLKAWAGSWEDCWEVTERCIGTEKKLTKFGRWVESIIDYYHTAPETSIDKIINDTMKKVN